MVNRKKSPAKPKPKPIEVEKSQEIIFQANPGPQTDFLASSEQEVLYGGPLTLDTDVLTPHGYKFMGDIEVGDTVFNKEGSPTKVVEVPFEGFEDSYEITFSDSTKITASAGHKWLVGTSDWKKTSQSFRVKTTKELLDFDLGRGRNKYFVPLNKPVAFKAQNIPLDPYFLGAMLGDGCLTKRCNMTFTTVDNEIVDFFKLPYGYTPKKIKGGIQWKFTQGQYGGRKNKDSVIWEAFKALGLSGKNSFTKFIPSCYLFNNVETRTAVLQGLMDTDGGIRKSELKFTTVSKNLKRDFVFLARSLGFLVTENKEILKSGSTAYRIYLSRGDICPFRLTRKVCLWKKANTQTPTKYITNISPVGKKDVRCITVDCPSHTFLTNNFTVTMNSAGGGKSVAMVIDPLRYANNPESQMLLLRKTTEELRELINISKKYYTQAVPGATFAEKEKTWRFPSGATLWMSYLDRDDDVMRYQGQAYNWIGFDELTQWASSYPWNYMRSRLRVSKNSGLPLHMRATTNPGGPGHSFVKKLFIDPAKPNTSFWATDEEGKVLTWPKGHSKEGQPLFKRRFIPANLFDNPHLAEDGMYEANLLSLPEQERRRLLEGDWDIQEGAAFTEFRSSVHVVEPFDIPQNWQRFRACDYGYGSYTGVLWFAVNPHTGQLIVYRELYVSKVTAADLAGLIKEAEEGERIAYGVLDSSLWHNRGDRGPSLAEQMISRGCRWRPSDRSKGSRIAGKNEIHQRLAVDEFTGEPDILFFNTCRNVIQQLPAIPLDKNNPEDVDTKAEDHLYDALRYGVMTRARNRGIREFSPTQRTGFQAADKVMGY